MLAMSKREADAVAAEESDQLERALALSLAEVGGSAKDASRKIASITSAAALPRPPSPLIATASRLVTTPDVPEVPQPSPPDVLATVQAENAKRATRSPITAATGALLVGAPDVAAKNTSCVPGSYVKGQYTTSLDEKWKKFETDCDELHRLTSSQFAGLSIVGRRPTPKTRTRT